MSKVLRAGLAIASMSALSGCSMLERYQVYEPKESPRVAVTEFAEVSVQFKPIHRFMSLGPMGLPVVPVAGDPTPVTEFEMIVTLSVKAHASFSLNSMPCLQAGTQTVCPHFVEVWETMTLPSTSKYAGSWAGHFEMELPIPERPRLTDEFLLDERIAGTYPPDRKEAASKWQSSSVSLTFSYKCPAECSAMISLPMDDLARVNDQASSGVRQFDRTPHTKYHFGFALQDG